jgi:hypothetical protein
LFSNASVSAENGRLKSKAWVASQSKGSVESATSVGPKSPRFGCPRERSGMASLMSAPGAQSTHDVMLCGQTLSIPKGIDCSPTLELSSQKAIGSTGNDVGGGRNPFAGGSCDLGPTGDALFERRAGFGWPSDVQYSSKRLLSRCWLCLAAGHETAMRASSRMHSRVRFNAST